MKLSDFDYTLPQEFIAQTPVEPRDSSRLMVLPREQGPIEHRVFRDIVDYLNPGDVLVLNTTRVIPARLYGTKLETGGAVEILLLRQLDDTRWHALVGGRRLMEGVRIDFGGVVSGTIQEVWQESERVIQFDVPINDMLDQLGEIPLPPYITAPLVDRERYQTVFSRQPGSAAAPTAGLHFTPELLIRLKERGIVVAECMLEIGLGTFLPVRVEDVEAHQIHGERARLSATDAKIINDAKLRGNRIIAVGTTAVRTLETAGILSEGGDPANPAASVDACPWRPVIAFDEETRLFIYPGYRWRVVDAIITNFHLPKSTLVMMISAFTSRNRLLEAYEVAKTEGYRFFSFGDAMFIS